MPSLNQVVLTGRLTRDPEIRYLPSGTALAEFGFAVDDSYKNKEGEWIDRPCFVNVVVWGKQGQESGENLSKGDLALVSGKLQFEQWENQQGEKRSKVSVRAFRIEALVPHRSGDREEQSAGGGSYPEAPDAGTPAPSTPAPSAPPPSEPAGDEEDLPF